jgi:hypothetical protein
MNNPCVLDRHNIPLFAIRLLKHCRPILSLRRLMNLAINPFRLKAKFRKARNMLLV